MTQYVDKSSWKRHLSDCVPAYIMGQGPSNFACPHTLCPAAFNSSDDLWYHLEDVHSVPKPKSSPGLTVGCQADAQLYSRPRPSSAQGSCSGGSFYSTCQTLRSRGDDEHSRPEDKPGHHHGGHCRGCGWELGERARGNGGHSRPESRPSHDNGGHCQGHGWERVEAPR